MSTRAKAIESPIKELSGLQIYPFPGRPFAVTRAVRIGMVHVAVNDKGRIYSSQASGNPVYWNSANRFAPTIQALIAMGMLSADAMEQHKEAEATERKQRNKRFAAGQILEAYEEAGLTLTDEQRAQMERLVAK